MTKSKLTEIAEKWIEAFCEHDTEKLISLYGERARHYSPRVEKEKPETNGWLEGREQLKDWWKNCFKQSPSLSYALTAITSGKGKVFIEYVRTVAGEPNSEVMEYLKVKNKLIIESRVLRSWPI